MERHKTAKNADLHDSQPFWANVVAAAGAGAKPIPQKEVTVERLTEALQFVLSREASQAATKIAQQMSRENGTRAAVDSFHRWLPLEEMRCQIDRSQVARWLLEMHGKHAIRVSDAVASVLLAKKKIKIDQLRP